VRSSRRAIQTLNELNELNELILKFASTLQFPAQVFLKAFLLIWEQLQ